MLNKIANGCIFKLKSVKALFSGKDSCNGDSGGPLFAREITDDPWVQIGLVSYGTTTCGKGVPGVYTKVSYYMDWIDDHLEP